MLPRVVPLTFLALTLSVVTCGAWSQTTQAEGDGLLPHPVHAEEASSELRIDAGRSLGDAVESALARAPGRAAIEARAAESGALSGRAGLWLSAAPALQLRQQTDRVGSGQGLSESEAGLDLPLAWPGQPSAWRREADASAAQHASEADLLRWQVAGEVRERYWRVIEARVLSEQAERDLATYRALEAEVRARVAAGDAAPLEALTAEGQRLDRETAALEARTQLADARFGWRSLTGWDALPLPPEEHEAERASVDPAVRDAEAAVERARAAMQSLRAERAGSPRLLVGVRHETDGVSNGIDSVGATLTVPFGGTRVRAPERAAAALDLARREDQRAGAQRASEMARHEAEHELHARGQALVLATTRAERAATELDLSRRAYAAGESSLAERLLAESRAADTARTHQQARIARDRALSRYNHAHGVLP